MKSLQISCSCETLVAKFPSFCVYGPEPEPNLHEEFQTFVQIQKLKALQIQNPNSGQFVHGGPFKKNIASRNSFAVQPHNRINRKERNDQSHEISSRF